MERTIPVFLNDTYLFKHYAKILKVLPKENDLFVILTDSTIFYPTGGGQPCDKGTMKRDNKIFTVSDVIHCSENREIIEHYGKFDGEVFAEGDEVEQTIDEEYRRKLARLHSGGHLLDQAMYAAGYNYPSSKGNHRVGESSVEYVAKVEAKERTELMEKVQVEVNKLIDASIPTVIKEMKASECSLVANFINPESIVRVVCVAGDCNYPCGGTHVKNTKEIMKLTLTKAISKKGQLRISYTTE